MLADIENKSHLWQAEIQKASNDGKAGGHHTERAAYIAESTFFSQVIFFPSIFSPG